MRRSARARPATERCSTASRWPNRFCRSSDGRADNRVWGVATWNDVDPRIDFFSVYVGGLTNAYRWEDPAGAYQAGDPPGTGRAVCPQDAAAQFLAAGRRVLRRDEREIRFGVARGKGDLYDVSEGVAYRWVYR